MRIKILENINVGFQDHRYARPENHHILRELQKDTYYFNVVISGDNIILPSGDIFYGVPGRFYKIYK